MNTPSTLSLLVVVSIALILTSCSNQPSNTYTVSVEYIAVGPEELPQDSELASESPDLSTSTITLYRKQSNANGEVEKVEIASKAFQNGKVVFKSYVDSQESIEITALASGSSATLNAVARVEPGSDIKLALLDYSLPYFEDRLILRGNALLLSDSPSKFTISGRVTPEMRNSKIITMRLQTTNLNAWGHEEFEELGMLMIESETFVYEGEAIEPRVVEMELRGENFAFWTEIIVEPGASISIHTRGSPNQAIATMPSGWFSKDQMGTRSSAERGMGGFFATAEGGSHTRLIESWQQSYTFLSTAEAFNVAMENYATREVQITDQSINRGSNTVTNTDEVTQTPLATRSSTMIVAAKGCEHVDLSKVDLEHDLDYSSPSELPTHERLARKMWELRDDALNRIARHGQDPMDSLLALELGALRSSRFEENFEDALQERVNVYDNLASVLDEETVTRRVNPARRFTVARLESYRSDRSLVPGQKAPQITLVNLERQEVAIYDVFERGNLSYVQFWEPPNGRWNFEELKELQAAYGELGFQIITISLQPDWSTWDTASDRDDITWLNLGDLSEDAPVGTIATVYGRDRFGKNFLIDNQGCILRKDLSTDELPSFLSENMNK